MIRLRDQYGPCVAKFSALAAADRMARLLDHAPARQGDSNRIACPVCECDCNVFVRDGWWFAEGSIVEFRCDGGMGRAA